MDLITAAMLAGACGALAALAVRWRARRRSAPSSSASAGEPAAGAAAGGPARDQLEDLRLADLVLYDGLELAVTGLTRCRERDERWIEGRLVDESVERWLVVRPQDPDAFVIGVRTEDLGLGPEPSEALEHAGKVYQLERCGQAQASGEGDLGGSPVDGEYRYWDYRRPGPDRLWIRRAHGLVMSFAGQRVARHLVCVLPGS